MRLRARRRDLVVFRQSAGPAGAYGAPTLAVPPRVRRRIHVGVLATAIGLMRLARTGRARWRPVLVAAALTAACVMLGGGAWGMLYFAGIWWLLHSLLTSGRPDAERGRRSELLQEIAGYRASAQRCDLGAILDRYPDGIADELRDVLAIS